MQRPDVSVVIPMYNEVENAVGTLSAVGAVLAEAGWSYELIPVDDGSTDRTGEVLADVTKSDPRVRPVVYRHNRGRGYALRKGFAVARGRYVVSLDADLSYTPDHAVRMVQTLIDDPEVDIVLASPYMSGGRVEGVPLIRLFFSKGGNWVLQRAMPQRIHTSTGIVRAYRAESLRSLSPQADGKEIHLEILSEAMALGMRVVEIPAVLRTRRAGSSKFRPRATVMSHLLFSLLARPAALFVGGGIALIVASGVVGAYLLTVYLGGGLNPERPLMTVMVLLLLGGAFALSFGVLSTQMLELRRAMIKLQSDMKLTRVALKEGGALESED